ncbi:MAG TPA: ABC transporter permease [Gaiellaceae bacterium]|jgi:peptide/nickel transport system permease protein|nr:ABC transporter permease [Gaiellaceae bacterium]
MLTYIVRRILYSIPVLFLSTFLSFLFVSYAGDPTAVLRANPRVPHSTYVHLYHQLHLDKPVIVRYFYWLDDTFTHKLGKSLITLQPLWPQITRTMGHTAQFIIISEILALILGVAVGIYSAIRQYSVFDYLFTSISFLGFAMPTFWLALLLQISFTDIYLHWNIRIFYTSGLNTVPGGPAWSIDRMQHLALPVLTLLIISFALYSRYMRASMLDVINSDYVRTARAKGVSEWRVVMRHVFRNALIPITTVAALNFGALLGGAIVTETVFSLDGIGYFFIQSLNSLDLYAVMAYLLITAIAIVVFNLIADILYGFLDPRIRYD